MKVGDVVRVTSAGNSRYGTVGRINTARVYEDWMLYSVVFADGKAADILEMDLELVDDPQVLTCAYCGQAYPPRTPASQHEALTAHIKVCAKHPMRQLEQQLTDLKVAMRDYPLVPSLGPLDSEQDCAAYTAFRDAYFAWRMRLINIINGNDTGNDKTGAPP
jgi:hypothetical protein